MVGISSIQREQFYRIECILNSSSIQVSILSLSLVHNCAMCQPNVHYGTCVERAVTKLNEKVTHFRANPSIINLFNYLIQNQNISENVFQSFSDFTVEHFGATRLRVT